MRLLVSRFALLCLLTVLYAGPAAADPRMPNPDIYPKIYQTMKSRMEPSDWAGLRQYDIIEIGNWGMTTSNGFIDSLALLRAENPDLVVLQMWSGNFTCSNWWSNETPGRAEWGALVDANIEDWILHDKNGNKWFLDVDAPCDQGHPNMANIEVSREFAKRIAATTVHAYPDLIDGVRIDALMSTMAWWHKVPQRWAVGVDSIDANRDGIGDKDEELEEWWSAGVDTFCATLRREIGDDYLFTVNGYLPEEAFQWVNGRYHEGHPDEHNDGYERSMTDPLRGYLGGDTLYSKTPQQLSGLLTINTDPQYELDPFDLSTKQTPYNHPDLDEFVRWTIGGSLLSDGWYCMTGWGTAVDWKGDPKKVTYQTLWWFDIYDTLKTHIGTPIGDAVRANSPIGHDRYTRQFTGGRVRTFMDLEISIFDFKPVVSTTAPPPVVRPGEQIPFEWSVSDLNGQSESLNLDLYLSRDGGATFPEHLGSFDENDVSYNWTASGAYSGNALFKITATDTSDQTGESISAPFVIAPATLTDGGRAELLPRYWVAGSPEVACTIWVDADLTDSSAAGWDLVSIVLPDNATYLSYSGAERDGHQLGDSSIVIGDTLRVVLDSSITSGTVSFRFSMTPPASIPVDSLYFEAGVASTLLGDPPIRLNAGDANSNGSDGNRLSVYAGPGPLVRLEILPGDTTLTSGDSLIFQVTGYDSWDNPVDVAPDWELGDTLGLIDSTGLFRAIRPGQIPVYGIVDGIADTAYILISTGPADSIAVQPESLFAQAGDTLVISAVPYDAAGNPIAEPVTWSVADSIAKVIGSGTLIALHPGLTSVTASIGSVARPVPLFILPGDPDHLQITPEEPIVTRGDTLRLHAIVFDRLNHPIESTVTWAITDSLGNIDSSGLFTADGEGSGWIRSTTGSVSDSVPADVVIGFVGAFLDPVSPVISADSTARFTLFGFTNDGDTLAVSPAWHLSDGLGTINEEGLYLPQLTGIEWIKAETGAFRESTTVTIVPGAPASIDLTGPDTVVAGETALFQTSILDGNGNDVESEVIFLSEAGCTSMDGNALSCTLAGDGNIVATVNGVSDTLHLVTLPAALAGVDISPEQVSIPLGGGLQFTATPRDRFGNTRSDSITWLVLGGLGSIDSNGNFVGLSPGIGILVGSSGGYSDSISVTVQEPLSGRELAKTVSVRASDREYSAADWPAPVTVVAELLDSLGAILTTEMSDSFLVTVYPTDSSLAANGTAESLFVVSTFPDTLNIPMTSFGGCGNLVLAIHWGDSLDVRNDTIPFSTPDLDTSFTVDLGDAGYLLDAIQSAGGSGCEDIDGDGFVDNSDLTLLFSLFDEPTAEAADQLAYPPPQWLYFGQSFAPCGDDDTTGSVFTLYSEGIDSIRAIEFTFAVDPIKHHGIQWALSSIWTDPTAYLLPADAASVRLVIVNGEPVDPDGETLLEMTVCGANENDWAARASSYRVLDPRFHVSGVFKTPIDFQLSTGDTSGTGGGGDTTGNSGLPLVLSFAPNPLGRSVETIRLAIPGEMKEVSYSLYNYAGRLVSELPAFPSTPGFHSVSWNRRDSRGHELPPGIYFLHVRSSEGAWTRKLTLIH